jgi:hypothetical protein
LSGDDHALVANSLTELTSILLAMLKVAANPRVKQVDYVLLAAGLGFLALSLFVY